MSTVYLGLGSNLGDREANLRDALRALWRMGRVESVSSLYETEPVGPPQPPFLNAACRFETGLEPRPLLRFLQGLEHELGRRPGGERWGPRPIDLDILLYEDRLVDEEGFVVPHPRLAERAFVLVPLAEIAAAVKHPELGKTVAQLQKAAGEQGVRRVAGAGWEGLEGMAAEKLRL
ncbi:MAG TPA: 2-amino-4-hydroxy-6-hydroxymethyldihydropteridine diphosphokinase [Dehalococcoidia bacterium]|nr:2-amino-4-hydroxy-6-hydroxymethyldihydropteridine diphosphokinase [Dehalococcoidia bacterium]